MQSIEIFNARVAMLAVVGYAVQEFITGNKLLELLCRAMYSLCSET